MLATVGALGARLRDRGGDRVDARVQLLLPAAGAHADARGRRETGRRSSSTSLTAVVASELSVAPGGARRRRSSASARRRCWRSRGRCPAARRPLDEIRGRGRGAHAARRATAPGAASTQPRRAGRAGRGDAAASATALRQSDAIKTAVLQTRLARLPNAARDDAAAVGGAARTATLTLTAEDRAELLETIRLEVDAADPPRRESARPLATAGRRCSAAPGALAGRGARSRGGRRGAAAPARVRSSRATVCRPARVDEIQIQRVLVNLIENAFKFSRRRRSRCSASRRDGERSVASTCSTGGPELGRRLRGPAQASVSRSRAASPRSTTVRSS